MRTLPLNPSQGRCWMKRTKTESVLEHNGVSYSEYKNFDEGEREAYDWAFENPTSTHFDYAAFGCGSLNCHYCWYSEYSADDPGSGIYALS